MRKATLIVSFFLSFNIWSQNLCRTQILAEKELFPKNEMNKYLKYDFSNLWNKIDNNLVYGILGENYERILMKFVSIKKTNQIIQEKKKYAIGVIIEFQM